MHSLAQLKVMGCQVKGRGWGRKPLHTLGGQGRQGRPCSHCGWESSLTAWPWGLDVTDDSALTLQTRAWDMCRMCVPGQKHKSVHGRLIVIALFKQPWWPSPALRSYRRKPSRRQCTKSGMAHSSERKKRDKMSIYGWTPSRCSNSRMGKTVFENVYRINETIQKSKKWIPWKSI